MGGTVGQNSFNLFSEYIMEVCSMLEYQFSIFDVSFSLKEVMIYTGVLGVVINIIMTVFDAD